MYKVWCVMCQLKSNVLNLTTRHTQRRLHLLSSPSQSHHKREFQDPKDESSKDTESRHDTGPLQEGQVIQEYPC